MLLAAIAACLLVACANMGRPEGGARDETPPVYVRSNPPIGALNVNRNNITVDFDENIQLDDPMNKIVVSPAQKAMPKISSVGKRVTVELQDTLIPNTTYTIDFSDAVKDLNEGNILDGLALDFATGDSIDSLRISGMVFSARDLEPAQGMLVGVYSNLADSAISTLPFERITKTNQLGQFTLRNLKPGTYRIYAVNDVNRDYHWDRSEDVAFYDVTLSPSSVPSTVADTLYSAGGMRDSIVTRAVTRFLPDDVLLTWFNEGYATQYLREYKRPDLNKLTFQFGTKADTLPILTLVNTPRAGEDISRWAALDANATLDTLTYWITDSAIFDLDSLILEAKYMRTDTLGQLSLATDTLRFILRGQQSKKKRMEREEKEREQAAKDEEARQKTNEEIRQRNLKRIEEGEDTIEWKQPKVPEQKYVDFKLSSPVSQDLNKPMLFKASTPIARFDTSAVRMEMLIDSTWYIAPKPRIYRPEPLHPMVWRADYTWEEGTKYRLTVDSAAITDIYGLVNKPVQTELTTKQRADYSSLFLNIRGLEGRPAMVELLSSSDKPVAAVPVKGSTATIEYITPGSYYVRLFIDSNADSLWTTGSLSDSIPLQPEEVYYYPKKINLKKNWDVEQEWDINELPVDTQKPREIVKNKPKRKKNDRDDREGYDDEEEDEFFDDPFMQNATRNNGFGGNNSMRNPSLRNVSGNNSARLR